tara:strand:- start:40 stop:1713 length:1674 start_codon:yes stop_codon:yes gene_type:complete
MKIEIKSTSYLLPSNTSWNSLKKNNKLIFSKYNNIFSNPKFNDKIQCEIFVLFLKDIIDYYKVLKNGIKDENKKIQLIIKLIKEKISIYKKKNFIISISSYYYLNHLNSSKNKPLEKEIEVFLYKELYNLSRKHANLYILNIDDLFSFHGLKNCFDERNYFLFRCRLSTLGLKLISDKLSELIFRINNTNKKVLLLDCDNTLWGGVIGEDGIEKIQLGQDGVGLAYMEFQKAIKKIQESGIILALVSKNNNDDVINVLEKHKSMILKKKDITAFKINWNEKSQNIRQLSKDLFLGLDSFVFWDDNPIERNKVRNEIGDVEVIEPKKDISYWSKQLLEYSGFSKFQITKEDYVKTKQYKSRGIFLEKKKSSKNEIAYLKKIKIKTKLISVENDNIGRASQLTEKTNQFNFNTKRYKIADIKRLKKNHLCFLVKLSDIYGDHGIVGFFILKKNKETLLVDLFLMSCRIMGRYLENWILNEIKKIAINNKKKNILFEFIPTKKNKELINNFIKSNNLKKINKKNIEKIEKQNLKLENKSKAEYYILNTKQKITNLEIYEK